MRLERRKYLLLVKERGSRKTAEHVLIDAFTAEEAKKEALVQYPNSNILVLETL